MANETFQTILSLSDERFQLYLLAGHQHLTPDELARLDYLTGHLSTLWDQYRRELAANGRESMERIADQAKFERRLFEQKSIAQDRRAA